MPPADAGVVMVAGRPDRPVGMGVPGTGLDGKSGWHTTRGMRVLEVATDTDRRGAQVFASELASTLRRRDWAVRVTALTSGRSEHALPFEVLGRRRLGASTLLSLREEIASADVAIGFGSSTLPACAIASIGTSVPFVYRSIGDLRFWVTSASKRFRVRRALARAHAVVALWPAAAATIVEDFGVDAERVHVIPRGVDPDVFRPVGIAERARLRRRLGVDDTAPVAAVVGSLSREKAVHRVFDVGEAIPELHVVVAGKGPLEEALRSEAERRMPGRAHFVGDVADTRPIYGLSDLLLLPSLSEGVPGVVIEAGMCGRAAVATDVGGTSSVIFDGVTGRLVPPHEIETFVDAVREVLEDPSALGAAARDKYRDRFSLDRTGELWAQLLESVVAASYSPST